MGIMINPAHTQNQPEAVWKAHTRQPPAAEHGGGVEGRTHLELKGAFSLHFLHISCEYIGQHGRRSHHQPKCKKIVFLQNIIMNLNFEFNK
jgi:hypothetical protein